MKLFRRCEAMGVGISVMKPFHGGKLLEASTSPFRTAMTRYQCIQYALDRPSVLSVVPGVRNLEDLRALLGFASATEAERDYSVIGQFTPAAAQGNCVYCNHCQPCPAGINIALVNKYYDLALAGTRWPKTIIRSWPSRPTPASGAATVTGAVPSTPPRAPACGRSTPISRPSPEPERHRPQGGISKRRYLLL